VIYEEKRQSIPAWERIFLTVLTILLAMVVVRSAFAEEGAVQAPPSCRAQVWHAVQKLQPWYYRDRDPVVLSRRAGHLRDFTEAVCAEAPSRGIDPLLAVALAFRESSLLPQVGLGQKNGARGERGYFQIMPDSFAERFAPEECSQHVPACNAKTAMSLLAWLRDERCQGAPQQWIGMYGRGVCAGPRESADWLEVQVARRFFCSIADDCAAVWPE
jgi:hypothetical protein